MPGTRSHYVSRKGYVVRKDRLKPGEESRIRRELEVCPFNPMQRMFSFGVDRDAGKFRCYRETDRKFYLPKQYGVAMFGAPRAAADDDLQDLTQYDATDMVFHGVLRPPQQAVANAALDRLRNDGGGILQLRCGFGKTIIALFLIATLRTKTLVVVHKGFLLTQWRERIEQFLPTARVGLIQQGVVDVDGKDIVIAMLQSLSMKSYATEVFAGFGMCCFDECHHLGAEVFSRALVKTSTRYMLGLSATPDRKDRLRRVFEWHLGTVVAAVDDGGNFKDVRVDTVPFDDPRVEENSAGRLCVRAVSGTILYNEDNPSCRAQLLKHLVESPERMALLETQILRLVEDPARRILVLSERRNHLVELGKRLAEHDIEHGFYWGGEKQANLDIAATKKVILGTFHMASEGFDVPCLNAIILATPKSDVKQSVGRILRKKDHPVPPLIVDIVDESLPNFRRQVLVRRRLYRQSGFQYREAQRPPSPPPLVGCAFLA